MSPLILKILWIFILSALVFKVEAARASREYIIKGFNDPGGCDTVGHVFDMADANHNVAKTRWWYAVVGGRTWSPSLIEQDSAGPNIIESCLPEDDGINFFWVTV